MNRYQSLLLLYTSSLLLTSVALPFFNLDNLSGPSSSSSSSSTPRKSSHPSLLLQQHRTIYTNRRPHDTSLYDILNVAPNATLVEIQKSWRRKSLMWHPDKVALRRRRRRDDENNNEQIQRDARQSDESTNNSYNDQSDNRVNMQRNDNNRNLEQHNEENDEEYAQKQLQQIQHAYEILSDDHNRLLYHKYGLIGGTDAAVQLLTGRCLRSSPSFPIVNNDVNNYDSNDGGGTTAEQIRLLELMGYHQNHPQSYTTSTNTQQQHRIHTLTTTITEYLRPLVEGSISQETFATQVHSEMNKLKKSPLGAQIIRCVGRAYKVEGWRVLRQMREDRHRLHSHSRRYHHYHNHYHRSTTSRRSGTNSRVDDILSDSWRNTKHYASAAYASGKLVLMEQRLKRMEEDQVREREERQKRRKRMEEEEERLKRIEGESVVQDGHVFSSNIGSLSDDEEEDEDEFDIGSLSDIDIDIDDTYTDMDDGMMFSASESEESDDHDEIEYELQHIQNQKAYTALLSLHQMEALWKVTKIELDKTVREACRWILTPTPHSSAASGGGWYAFCPSEQSPYQDDWEHYRPPPPPPPPPGSSSHYHSTRQHRQHHHQQHRSRRRHTEADGWVGSNGKVVPMEVGRLRAAAAMVFVGDIMVQCSKEGTSWRKKK